MHFDVLVEDQSGKRMLDLLLPKIVRAEDTFSVISYKGVGRIPKGMQAVGDANHRQLLDQLPKILRGYGRTHTAWGSSYPAAVVVVCDLDRKCLKEFREQLYAVYNACDPKPAARFCIAIEEGEAWLLGDLDAVRTAYPKAKQDALTTYVQDSICDTWEKMADALYSGGAKALQAQGWSVVGAEKSRWSENITPFMNPERNRSPSFRYFRNTLKELAGQS